MSIPNNFEDQFPANPFEVIARRLDRLESKLDRMVPHEKKELDDQVFDMNSLPKYLPGNPSKATIYRWVSERSVPYFKVQGKTLGFWKSEIDQWLKSKKKQTHQELAESI